MATLLKLLLKTQRYPLDIRIVCQCKIILSSSHLACVIILCTIPIFTVSNVVTRVETDDCNSGSSKLAQYAMELLTSTLAQLSSDTQSQGKLGLLVTVGIESDPIKLHACTVPLFLLSNTTLIQKIANISCPPKVYIIYELAH